MELEKVFKQNADYTPFDTQDPDDKFMSEEMFIKVVSDLLSKQ